MRKGRAGMRNGDSSNAYSGSSRKSPVCATFSAKVGTGSGLSATLCAAVSKIPRNCSGEASGWARRVWRSAAWSLASSRTWVMVRPGQLV